MLSWLKGVIVPALVCAGIVVGIFGVLILGATAMGY